MSRRRRKSPLLARTLAISVGVNVILLPILAHFGAFKKLESSIHEARVVLVKPADTAEDKEMAKSKDEKKPDAKKAEKSKSPSVKRSGTPLKANPNAPKVVTSSGDSGGAGEGGPAIQQGSGKAGEIPVTAPRPAAPPTSSRPIGEAPKSTSEVKPESKPKEVPPKAEPAPKHVPVYREPDVSYGPEPVIPDDLRDQALEATVVAEFEIGPDGVPASVALTRRSGNAELDQIALETARKWRFKPASLDGKGVASRVRLKMEFTVE